MPREIERKFLPINNLWHDRIDASKTILIHQGYIDLSLSRARIRITQRCDGSQEAFLYLKNKRDVNTQEFEIRIPIDTRLDELTQHCVAPAKEKKHRSTDITVDAHAAPIITETTRQYDINRECTLRMRRVTHHASGVQSGVITLKSPRVIDRKSIQRTEVEYDTSAELAHELFENIVVSTVEKVRYFIAHSDANVEWTIDHFSEPRHGDLLLAEAELKGEADMENLALPDYIATPKGVCVEVTNVDGFTSSKLARMDKLTRTIIQHMEAAEALAG